MLRRRVGSIVLLLALCPFLVGWPASGQVFQGGFEEFRIEIDSGTQSPGDKAGAAPEWQVTVRACPIPEFNGLSSRIPVVLTKNQLSSLRSSLGQNPDMAKLRVIGNEIRKSIFSEKSELALEASVKFARNRGKGLRLVVVLKGERISDDVISPADLPIELIHFPETPTLSEFPATSPTFTVSRTLDLPPLPPGKKASSPIRMLVVAASPTDQPATGADESLAAIRGALKGLAYDGMEQSLADGSVRVKLCTPPTRDQLQKLLNEGPWDIVHFIGHGSYERILKDSPPQAQILLERPDNRESDRFEAAKFAAALNNHGVRLVVLSACSSAAAQPDKPAEKKDSAIAFDGVAHHLMRDAGVPAVVAMQFDFEVAAARDFTRELYTSFLSEQQDIDVAVSRCRQVLFSKFGVGSRAWITPVLYSRVPDGRLFEFGRPAAIPVGTKVVLKPKAKVTQQNEVVVSEDEYPHRIYTVLDVDKELGLRVATWGVTKNVKAVDPKLGIVGWVKPEDVIPRRGEVEYYTNLLADRPGDVDLLIHRGMAFSEMQMFDKARRDFDEAFAKGKEHATVIALVNRASSWGNQWKEAEVIRDCTKAIDLDPGFEWAYIVRAIAYTVQRRHDSARNDLDQALRIDPTSAAALVGRAWILSQIAKHNEALKDAQAALNLDPTSPAVHSTLGAIYFGMGDFENARQNLEEAIRLDPLSAWSHSSLARVRGQAKRYDKAIDECNEALRLNPDFAPAYAVRGVTWANIGDKDRALTDCDKAIKLFSNPAWAYQMRGTANATLGNSDGAVKDFSEAIDRDPTLAEAYVSRGSAYGNKGDHDRALADFETAIKLDPQQAPAYLGRGAAYTSKGALDAAIKDFTAAIDRDPKLVAAYVSRGTAYGNKGDHDRALADFETAIKLDPQHAPAYLGRGNVYLNKGALDAAIKDFTAAIDRDPKMPGAYAARGLAYGNKGDHGQALINFNKAIELAPGVAMYYDSRAVALGNLGRPADAAKDRAEAARLKNQRK
jgi:tetratricopeptide (TPR) repeat protein